MQKGGTDPHCNSASFSCTRSPVAGDALFFASDLWSLSAYTQSINQDPPAGISDAQERDPGSERPRIANSVANQIDFLLQCCPAAADLL